MSPQRHSAMRFASGGQDSYVSWTADFFKQRLQTECCILYKEAKTAMCHERQTSLSRDCRRSVVFYTHLSLSSLHALFNASGRTAFVSNHWTHLKKMILLNMFLFSGLLMDNFACRTHLGGLLHPDRAFHRITQRPDISISSHTDSHRGQTSGF